MRSLLKFARPKVGQSRIIVVCRSHKAGVMQDRNQALQSSAVAALDIDAFIITAQHQHGCVEFLHSRAHRLDLQDGMVGQCREQAADFLVCCDIHGSNVPQVPSAGYPDIYG